MNKLHIYQIIRDNIRFSYFAIKFITYLVFPKLISPVKTISSDKLSEDSRVDAREFYFKESYTFKERINHLDTRSFFKLPKNNGFDEIFYIFESNIFQYDSNNEIVFINNKIYSGMSPNPFRNDFFKKFDFFINKGFFNQKSRLLDQYSPLIISTKNDNNHYHFMTDLVPKLLLSLSSNYHFDSIIAGKNQVSKVKEILTFLNFEKVELLDEILTGVVEFKKSIVTSMITPHISPYKIKLFNDLIRSRLVFNKNTRIYISRSKAQIRKLKNEDQLIEELIELNFEVIFLENLTLMEQLNIFSKAEIVLSVHGAGLTNILFSESSISVCEIFPIDNIQPHYYELANYLGMNYFSIIGGMQSGLSNEFEVEIDKVMATVELALSNERG